MTTSTLADSILADSTLAGSTLADSTLGNAPSAAPASQPRPVLRLVPPLRAPEPVQLAFDFEWEVSPGVPATPAAPRHLRLVHGATPRRLSDDEILGMPQADLWIAKLSLAIFEVASGLRPSGQLTTYVQRDELARIALRGKAVARHPSNRGRVQPRRAQRVRSIRVCQISHDVVEVSAVISGGERAQAIGMRMARANGNWQVTDIALP